jgi:uncharacterized protein YbjQ (UPF0145 family)
MLLSTLPDFAGKRYEARGVVGSVLRLGAAGNDSLKSAFADLAQQAAAMGADAVINIKISAPSGERAIAAVIGTAVTIIG